MKIFLISFFSSNNLGDLALSNAIQKIIKENLENMDEITFCDFTTFKIKENLKRNIDEIPKYYICKNSQNKIKNKIKRIINERIIFEIRNVINFKKWRIIKKEIRKSDIVIIAGGNMIMDITSIWPNIFLKYCNIATKFNKKINLLYIGAGPINYEKSEIIYKNAFNLIENISVRDNESMKVAKSLTNKYIIQTVDPVFGLRVNNYEERIKRILDKNRQIKLGICVLSKICFKELSDYNYYINLIIEIIKKINFEFKNIEINLFSTESLDYEAIYFLNSVLHDKNIKIKKINNTEKLIEFYRNLDFLIGGRMHSLIFAQKCHLPYIGIIWQNKLLGFSNITDSKKFIYELKKINIEEDVINTIKSMLNNKEKIYYMKNKNEELEKEVRLGFKI